MWTRKVFVKLEISFALKKTESVRSNIAPIIEVISWGNKRDPSVFGISDSISEPGGKSITADLVNLTEEILNGKLHFLCSELRKIFKCLWPLIWKLILFLSTQFHQKGYATLFRFDWNTNGGGILLGIREDISSMLLNSDLKSFSLN